MPYQTDYSETHNAYLEGMVIDPHTCDISTYIADGDIGFGVCVKRAATAKGDKEVVAGIEPASGGSGTFGHTEFYGISVLNPALDPERAIDKYKDGDHVSVMWRGDIVVKVKAAVTAGSNVRVDTADNAFTSAAASATVRTITGAKFLTDAAADGLAQLRLYGNEQLLAAT